MPNNIVVLNDLWAESMELQMKLEEFVPGFHTYVREQEQGQKPELPGLLSSEASGLVTPKFVPNPDKTVVVLFSGGLDSTALVGGLLNDGFDVLPLYQIARDGLFMTRELSAVKKIHSMISKYFNGREGTGHFYEPIVRDNMTFINTFKESPILVPNRNQLFVLYAVEQVMKPLGISKLGMGEYSGAEKWVVTWHVPTADTEPSLLRNFLQFILPGSEYFDLDRYGDASTKDLRLGIGIDQLGVDIMAETTCCLSNTLNECGRCYTCVERHTAWHMLGIKDPTFYDHDPEKSYLFKKYCDQMEKK